MFLYEDIDISGINVDVELKLINLVKRTCSKPGAHRAATFDRDHRYFQVKNA